MQQIIEALEAKAGRAVDLAIRLNTNGLPKLADRVVDRANSYRMLAFFKRLFYQHKEINGRVVVTDQPLRHSSQPWGKVDRVFVVSAGGEAIIIHRI